MITLEKSSSIAPAVQASRRIPSLDGLRAISIIMVLLGHASHYLPSAISNNILFEYIANSTLGVSIFFIISGYLITKLLIAERDKTGGVSLKNFYVRRILRIFPVFYLYILLLVVLKITVFPNIINNWTEIGLASLYLWNYKHIFYPGGNATTYLGHYWSLSMEEQFYLFYPFLFIKLKPRKLIYLIVIILSLMPLTRVATYFLMPGSRGQLHMMIHTGGDTIFMGCLGALIEHEKNIFEKYRTYLSYTWVGVIAALFIFLISRTLNMFVGGAYSMSVGQSIENLFVLVFVLWSINGKSKFNKLLNTKPFIQIGIISYSIYVWHVLFLNNPHHTFPDSIAIKFILIFVAAFTSYYGIESPILKLKEKFKRV